MSHSATIIMAHVNFLFLGALNEKTLARILIPVAASVTATSVSAEIITATNDGNTLIYSDSPLGGIGFIDIRNASAPKPPALFALMVSLPL